jgi:predicted transcriptional regulator
VAFAEGAKRKLVITTKEQIRTLLDRLQDDCCLDDVQYHLYVLQALARGEADEEAGRVIPHEQVESELRRKWVLGHADASAVAEYRSAGHC